MGNKSSGPIKNVFDEVKKAEREASRIREIAQREAQNQVNRIKNEEENRRRIEQETKERKKKQRLDEMSQLSNTLTEMNKLIDKTKQEKDDLEAELKKRKEEKLLFEEKYDIKETEIP